MPSVTKIGLLFNHYLIPLEYGFANSMQKEYNRAEDGTVLSEKHTFTIRGAIVSEGDDAYARYQKLVIELNQQYINLDKEASLVDRLMSLRGGPLKLGEIILENADFANYTIDDSKLSLQYKYAQLININIAEAPEDTAGTHFQEITMSFEAIIGPQSDEDAFVLNEYRIKSASENFEIKKEEDKISYFVFDTELPNGSGKILADKDNPYYSYTITHNLAAQGLPYYYDKTASLNNRYSSADISTQLPPGDTNKAASEAFYEAYRYVNSKKKDTLIGSVINTDAFGRSYLGGTAFLPVGWTIGDVTAGEPESQFTRTVDVLIKKPPGATTSSSFAGTIPEVDQVSGIMSRLLYQSGIYKEYNVVRTSTADMMGGSYSLTTTYFYSRSPANLEINGSYEKSEDGNDTIRVNGTITGLDSNGVTSDKSNKYTNARFALEQICKKGLGSDESNTIKSHDAVFTNKSRELNMAFNDIIPENKTYIDEQTLIEPLDANDIQAGISTYKFELNAENASVPAGLSATGVSSKVLSPWGIGTNIYRFANTIFEDNKYSSFYEDNMVMDVRPISTSITENKVAGTIQFDVTYKAIPYELRKLKLEIPDCLSVTVNIQDDNKYRVFGENGTISSSGIRVAHIVPVMVLGRTQGPILQSMVTTKQSERKVQLEATLDVSQRYPSNDHCIEKAMSAILMYAPSGNPQFPMHKKSYLTELTNSWDWPNGKLTINAGWTYTQ